MKALILAAGMGTRLLNNTKDIPKCLVNVGGEPILSHQIKALIANNIKEIKRRFPEKNNAPNLFILKKDANLDKYGKTSTIGNIFVDLWNLEEWYAKEFLNAIEKRLS